MIEMTTTKKTTNRVPTSELQKTAERLRLYGLLANWSDVATEPWLVEVIQMEDEEHARRSHDYRLRNAKIGAFKPMDDFDWRHPKKLDRRQVDDIFGLDFIEDGINVVFIGPNGAGKTMLARNLAYQAVSRGVSTRYTSASDMLSALSGFNGSVLTQRLKRFCAPSLLVVDELGYLRYDAALADLLYEVISRRYEANVSTVITTNLPFSQWNQVFEGAACVATMIDRLCHPVEIVQIEAESFRAHESQRRVRARRAKRSA
jgi:DNA replication protein DnaC